MLKDASPPPSATEKLRTFLRSGRYRAPERLDDYGGDYCSAPLLGPVETADMHYHRERLGDTTEVPEEVSGPPIEPVPDRNGTNLTAALNADPPAGLYPLTLSTDRCLHRYARREICRRCIDVCPSGALRPGDHEPIIDHTDCTECAACVNACPTNAIRWLPDSPQALLQRVRERLEVHAREGAAPVVVFIPEATNHPKGPKASCPEESPPKEPPIVVVEVAPIALVDAAVLLSTMALGATAVRIVLDEAVGASVHRHVSTVIQWTQQLLRAWGFVGDRVGLLFPTGETICLPTYATGYSIPPADYHLDHPERILIRRAVEHLARHSQHPAGMVPLPDGTPFGAVSIDGSRCTLCMACAGACRTKALVALNGNEPGLGFTESLCVQCGACALVCPEQAITPVPRMNPDPVDTVACLPLHQAPAAHCSICGRVFASSQMIASIQAKLRGHWMYSDSAAQRRLQMCDHCRVQDLFRRNQPDSAAAESTTP